MMKKVGVVMGSKSDLPIVRKSVETLKSLAVPCEVHIFSAHRTPESAGRFAQEAASRGFGVLIAAAGMAAHLAGAMAAHTILPVIGLPLRSGALDGMDALLSTVQMPPGIPVATVGIDAARNAALLAAQILATDDAGLADRLTAQRRENAHSVLEADRAVAEEFNARVEEE